MARIDGREYDEIRPARITTGYQDYAEGSVLIEMGNTKVICSVTIEEKVPMFLKGSGTGWVTAEYSMLPRSTNTRSPRESSGKVSGRSKEIQRLIGRSLRAVTDMAALGERRCIVDCDVLQADGGTRTAAITGAYVALYQAMKKLMDMGMISKMPLVNAVSAVSVGLINNRLLLDLCYDEDSNAMADFNIVATDSGEFVEIQGAAEQKPYTRETIDMVLDLASKGTQKLFELQKQAIKELG